MENFLPTYTESFLRGQNVLYTQFNDIEFYIEDKEQENLYYQILKKIFSDIKFEKIFPLEGKNNVIEECEKNIDNRKKIFIVDKDFDDILGQILSYSNLFYLDGYSIENHLICKSSIYELIREKNPKFKDSDITQIYNYSLMLKKLQCLSELSNIFLIIQIHDLRIEYLSINCNRDFNITTDFKYKSDEISLFKVLVETTLKQKDSRYTINAQIKNNRKHFKSSGNYLKNIPGKYLLNMINEILKKNKLIHQYSLESLTYKLSKDVHFKNFENLKTNVVTYIQS